MLVFGPSSPRPGVKPGMLRQKLSQRPGGIFKRTTLQERGKIVKVLLARN